jgi:hypothetical protein
VEKYGRSGQATDDSVRGTYALHAGWLSLQKHAQNIYKTLLFHGYTDYANTYQCYIMCTLPVLLSPNVIVLEWRQSYISVMWTQKMCSVLL